VKADNLAVPFLCVRNLTKLRSISRMGSLSHREYTDSLIDSIVPVCKTSNHPSCPDNSRHFGNRCKNKAVDCRRKICLVGVVDCNKSKFLVGR